VAEQKKEEKSKKAEPKKPVKKDAEPKKPVKKEEAKKEAKPEPKPKKAEKPVEKPEPKKEAKPIAEEAEPKPKKGEKEEEKKFVRESVHTIGLRRAFDHPRTSRTKYAVREIKEYIVKHTRKEPFVDPSVNEALWAKGIQSPPRRIKVKIQEEEKKATAVLA